LYREVMPQKSGPPAAQADPLRHATKPKSEDPSPCYGTTTGISFDAVALEPQLFSENTRT